MVFLTLVYECGSAAIEIVDATYPTDDEGTPTRTAFERCRYEACGRTGGYSFGDGVDRTTGCLTTRRSR